MKISNDNTNVKKLWNLAKNGVFDYRMIKDIIKNADENITFKSKHSYKKFKTLEFSNLAF